MIRVGDEVRDRRDGERAIVLEVDSEEKQLLVGTVVRWWQKLDGGGRTRMERWPTPAVERVDFSRRLALLIGAGYAIGLSLGYLLSRIML